MPYLQDYLRKVGAKKCEANAIVTMPHMAKKLCEEAVVNYVGDEAVGRFNRKRVDVENKLHSFLKDTGAIHKINRAIEIIEDNL